MEITVDSLNRIDRVKDLKSHMTTGYKQAKPGYQYIVIKLKFNQVGEVERTIIPDAYLFTKEGRYRSRGGIIINENVIGSSLEFEVPLGSSAERLEISSMLFDISSLDK